MKKSFKGCLIVSLKSIKTNKVELVSLDKDFDKFKIKRIEPSALFINLFRNYFKSKFLTQSLEMFVKSYNPTQFIFFNI